MGYIVADKWVIINNSVSTKGEQKIDVSSGLTAEYLTPVEQLTDGGFENWSITGYSPDGWEYDSMGGTAVARSTDKHAGTYAALLTSDSSFGVIYISDLFNGGDAGSLETLQLKLWGKRLTGEADIFYVYGYREGEGEEETGYYYNFTGDLVGTWTAEGEEGPTSDQIGTIALTSSYAQAVGTQVTMPEGKTGGGVMFGLASTVTGATAVIDDVEILVASVDVAVNGGFENWTAIDLPTSWHTGQFGDDEGVGTPTTFTKESTIVNAGTYAIKSVGNNGNYSFVGQLIEGGTADEVLTASYYARGDAGNAGTPATKMCFLNHDLDNATQVWKVDTEEWEAYTDIQSLDSDNFITLNINTSETYTESSETLTIPASEKVYMIVYTEIPTDDDIVYVDTASVTKEDTGYGPLMSVNNTTGKVTFDKEIASADATADSSVVNLGQLKETGVVLLGSALVDMKTVAQTTIYTATGTEIPLFLTAICETLEDYTVSPTWTVGTNAGGGYNNMYLAGGIPGGVGAKTTYPLADGYTMGTTHGSTVKVNVTEGSTATAHTVRFYLFGIKL